MTDRKPLTVEELEELDTYSELHSELVDILIERRDELDEGTVLRLEDALLKSLKPAESRRDFVELTMLRSGAPHLIRAVERTWPNSRVVVSPFQNPESMGVSLDLIIGETVASWPSIADSILDSEGTVIDPLRKI